MSEFRARYGVEGVERTWEGDRAELERWQAMFVTSSDGVIVEHKLVGHGVQEGDVYGHIGHAAVLSEKCEICQLLDLTRVVQERAEV